MKSVKYTTFFLVLFGSFIFHIQEAHAIFTLSVSPRRGGRDIRFEASPAGQLLRNEEVTVSVTSTAAVQYRISQTVYQPLTDETGHVIPQGAFIFFSPSEPLGVLRPKLETPITIGQMPIFTSNSAGDSDSFVLVYNVHVPEGQPGGTYRAQMTFMLEPVSAQSAVSQQVVNLEAIVEIRPNFNIEIKDSKGARSLDLGEISEHRKEASGVLNIKIESNIGTTYRITQKLTDPLVSQEGDFLDENVFSVVLSGGKAGHLSSEGSPAAVSESSGLLYASSDTGAGDAIQAQYVLKPNADQKAGIYKGNLQFKADSTSPLVPSEVFNIPTQVLIGPIFYLDMELGQGLNDIQFGIFRTNNEAREKKVILNVHSNLGKPYQVSQIVTRKLTNPEGAVIPPGNFLYFGEPAQTGIVKVLSPTPVSDGESVVFTSDKKGTPEKFVLNYSLKIPVNTKGGQYTSDVRYSITSL